MKNSPDLKAMISGCNKDHGFLVLADYLEEQGFWRIAQELRGMIVGPTVTVTVAVTVKVINNGAVAQLDRAFVFYTKGLGSNPNSPT